MRALLFFILFFFGVIFSLHALTNTGTTDDSIKNLCLGSLGYYTRPELIEGVCERSITKDGNIKTYSGIADILIGDLDTLLSNKLIQIEQRLLQDKTVHQYTIHYSKFISGDLITITIYVSGNNDLFIEQYPLSYSVNNRSFITLDQVLSKKDIKKITEVLKNNAACEVKQEEMTNYFSLETDNSGNTSTIVFYPCKYSSLFPVRVSYPLLRIEDTFDNCKTILTRVKSSYGADNLIGRESLFCIDKSPIDNISINTSLIKNIKKYERSIYNIENPESVYWFHHDLVNSGVVISLLTLNSLVHEDSGTYYDIFSLNYNINTKKFISIEQLLNNKQRQLILKNIQNYLKKKYVTWDGNINPNWVYNKNINPYDWKPTSESDLFIAPTVHANKSGKITSIIFNFRKSAIYRPLSLEVDYSTLKVISN